jgi:F-type H+-transporting ATPase subunit epsilon
MLKLEIVTPERRIVDTEADTVTVPTASGDVGLLPGHAPMISALRPGILTYAARGREDRIAVAGGFVEINRDKVSVLADAAETADEVDADAARAARTELERSLEDAWQQPVEETDPLREQLEAADARLRLAAGK